MRTDRVLYLFAIDGYHTMGYSLFAMESEIVALSEKACQCDVTSTGNVKLPDMKSMLKVE